MDEGVSTGLSCCGSFREIFFSPAYRHVVLGDKRGDLEVITADNLVQVLHSRQAVHLVLDGGCHEGREPPRHHLGRAEQAGHRSDRVTGATLEWIRRAEPDGAERVSHPALTFVQKVG